MHLAHVLTTEAVRQTGELGERGDVVRGTLQFAPITPRQVALEEKFGGLFAIRHEGLARDRVQGLDGARQVLEVTADEAGIGDADLELLPLDGELDLVETAVGLTEAEDGNVDRSGHEEGPTEHTEHTEKGLDPNPAPTPNLSVYSVCSVGELFQVVFNTRLR